MKHVAQKEIEKRASTGKRTGNKVGIKEFKEMVISSRSQKGSQMR
jgi:hypothetical protein